MLKCQQAQLVIFHYLCRYPHHALDLRHAVSGSKRSLSPRKRALRVAVLEFSHAFHAGSVCDIRSPVACWVFHDCSGQEGLGNSSQRSVRYQHEGGRLSPHSPVQCFLFHRLGVELFSRVQFVPSQFCTRSAPAVACENDSRHRQVFVPVSAVVPCVRMGGEEGVLAVRPGQGSLCWKCN